MPDILAFLRQLAPDAATSTLLGALAFILCWILAPGLMLVVSCVVFVVAGILSLATICFFIGNLIKELFNV